MHVWIEVHGRLALISRLRAIKRIDSPRRVHVSITQLKTQGPSRACIESNNEEEEEERRTATDEEAPLDAS